MTPIQKRFLLFLIGCIGTRILLAVAAKNCSIEYLRYMGYIALIPAIGFTYIYLSGSRKTGPEVFGGKIWWNDLRPFHALLYFLFAQHAINGDKWAWIYLGLDVTLGLMAFLIYHYLAGDFSRDFTD